MGVRQVSHQVGQHPTLHPAVRHVPQAVGLVDEHPKVDGLAGDLDVIGAPRADVPVLSCEPSDLGVFVIQT